MKTLYLLRHAKSGWDDPVVRDFDRPLNRKGHRAAEAMGRRMQALHLRFDAAIASPARRVHETIESIEAGLGETLEADFDRRIYLAPAAVLLDVIHGAPAGADSLLLIGHNPGLEELVLLLVPDRAQHAASDAERDKVEEKYPTASLAEIRIDVGDWPSVAPGSGTLMRFVRPRDLDPALGPDHAPAWDFSRND